MYMKYVQDVILFERLSMNTLCSIISVLTWTDGPCGSSWTCSWTWTGGGGGRSWTAWTGSSWTMLTWGSSWTVGGVALWTTTAFATGSLKICSIFHVWFRIYEGGRRSKSRLKEREKGQGDRRRKEKYIYTYRERRKEIRKMLTWCFGVGLTLGAVTCGGGVGWCTGGAVIFEMHIIYMSSFMTKSCIFSRFFCVFFFTWCWL